MGGGEVDAGFWWVNLKVREHLEDSCVDEMVILR
jgi:hypothetical protein